MFAEHNKGKHYWPGIGYVRGKVARRVLLAGRGKDIKCPFCRTYTNTENAIRNCPSCGRKWFQKRNGDYVFVA